MGFAIGVDIGGSAIKFAVVDRSGAVAWPPGGRVDRVSYSVQAPGSAMLAWQFTGEVEEIACDLAPDEGPGGKWVVPAAVAQAALAKVLRRIETGFPHPVAAAGIGATGLIGRDGIVKEGYAFAGYRGVDWAAVAAEAGFGGAVRVLNDARAGAWAEYAAAGAPSGAFLHVTAGTRIGCAVIRHRRFLDGADSCAGEFSYQQLIRPGSDPYRSDRNARYRAGARVMDGLAGDPTALGAALVGVLHMANPNGVVLRGFAPNLVAAVQAHLDRHVFRTHLRPIVLEAGEPGEDFDGAARAAAERYGENPGSLLYVARRSRDLASALLVDGERFDGCPGDGAGFLSRMIVCSPAALASQGDLHFVEAAGSLGIEAEYAARCGRRLRFDQVVAAALAGDHTAAASLEIAAKVAAAGIANACRITGARLVTVGGAVPLLYRPYLQTAAGYVAAQLHGCSPIPTLTAGAAGNDAGVIGAALYALRST
jgi:predicted NBD/HSP70 family sugar kinase